MTLERQWPRALLPVGTCQSCVVRRASTEGRSVAEFGPRLMDVRLCVPHPMRVDWLGTPTCG